MVAVGTQNGRGGGSAKGGKWYFVVTIVSGGLLACVPIFHAASALGEKRLRKLGAAYAGAGGLLFVLASLSPTTETGESSGTLSSLVGLVSIVTIVAACIQLTPLRRRVYGADTPAISPPPAHDAVAAVKRARVQRTAARELASRDPLMARELRIGRPDLPREYDDGGLVDLNAAPAQTIADFCQVPEPVARAITDTRATIGRFSSVEEAMMYANVDYESAAVIKDRAIVI